MQYMYSHPYVPKQPPSKLQFHIEEVRTYLAGETIKMGANGSRERSTTDEEGSSENGGMPNDNDNRSNAGLAAGANNESRESSRTDEERSSERDVVANVAIAAAAVAGVALLAWGLSGTFSGNSDQIQGKNKSEIKMGDNKGSSSSKGGSQNGGSGAGKAGGGGGRQEIQRFWSPPPSGWIKVNTDGSCRGIDSKYIAAGGLLRDEEGAWIKGFTFNIGVGTVQEAELWGILKGLSLAWENGFKKVRVECDSETAVKLIHNSQLRANHSLVDLITGCKDFMSKSWDCDVVYVNREKNKAADHLAGLSFENDVGNYHVLDSPPSSLERFLVYDKAPVAASRAVPAALSWT